MRNMRIMYLRDQHYQPIGCIACSVDRKHHRLNYQFSVRNPLDRFNRAVARQLALGRLVECPITLPLDKLDKDDEVTMHTVSMLIMKDIVNSKAPTRAVKAARLWLSNAL